MHLILLARGVSICEGTKTCKLKPSRIGTGEVKETVCMEVAPTTKLSGVTEIVAIGIPYCIVTVSAVLT